MKKISLNLLKKISIFQGLKEKDIENIGNNCSLKIYKAESRIILENKKPDKIYILEEGKLIVKKADGTNSRILGHIYPGDLFGEISLIKNKSAMASVICKENCEIWEIDNNYFLKFLENHPKIKENINTIINNRNISNKDNLKIQQSYSQNEFKIDFII